MGEAKRRRAKGQPRVECFDIPLDEIDRRCDITVEGKPHQTVMIVANAAGRKVTEDLWPEVCWSRDAVFASVHAAEWQFTHIRITRLPYRLDDTPVALEWAAPDSLSFVVALALQRRAAPHRVFHFIGEGEDLKIQAYDPAKTSDEGMTVEYVPAGTPIGVRKQVS
jgi:hypothetical protein